MFQRDDDAGLLLADAVGQLPCDVELPASWDDFFNEAAESKYAAVPEEKRRYARRHLRALAGLEYRQTVRVLGASEDVVSRLHDGSVARRAVLPALGAALSAGADADGLARPEGPPAPAQP